MAEAKRDQNHVTSILFESASTPGLTVNAKGDEATGRLYVDNATGSGTVTSVSVVTANGFAGSVANPTTTPAITLSTTVTGILQGNGTAISAASTTGSGAVVLGTSPTLVTPNLGTPSAVVLTNGTGLPVSTGISGLGTGIATFLATPSSANLAAAVTDETGSGSLVFAISPTLVTPALGVATATSLDVAGANVTTSTTQIGNLDVRTTNAQGIDVGGSITMGGYNDNAATAMRIFGSIEGRKENGTTANSAGYVIIKTNNAGTLTSWIRISSTGVVSPNANDASTLGSATLSWSDLFLASGALLNFSNGNAVITHSSGTLTVTTGDLRVTTANVGTNADTVPTLTSASTFTNKRMVDRVTSVTSSATPTFNTDLFDDLSITALATNITSMTTNLSGTPNNFDRKVIRIKDNGSARTIAWGASFADYGGGLPATTVANKVTTVGVIYDSVAAVWGSVASVTQP